MAKALGCRKGFTLIEEVIVIAILAVLVIPIVTLLHQSILMQTYGSTKLKGDYYANLIMQDFERSIRRAENGTITVTSTATSYKVTFICKDADENGNYVSDNTYNYEIDDQNTPDAIFYKWINSNAKEVFPEGLEKGIIKNFTLDGSNFDTTNSAPPYYVKVTIETATGTTFEKTIYLINYEQ